MKDSTAGPSAETLADCALIAAKVFEAMAWRWDFSGRGDLHTPDAETILGDLRHLVRMLSEEDEQTGARVGRLWVERDGHKYAVGIELGSWVAP